MLTRWSAPEMQISWRDSMQTELYLSTEVSACTNVLEISTVRPAWNYRQVGRISHVLCGTRPYLRIFYQITANLQYVRFFSVVSDVYTAIQSILHTFLLKVSKRNGFSCSLPQRRSVSARMSARHLGSHKQHRRFRLYVILVRFEPFKVGPEYVFQLVIYPTASNATTIEPLSWQWKHWNRTVFTTVTHVTTGNPLKRVVATRILTDKWVSLVTTFLPLNLTI